MAVLLSVGCSRLNPDYAEQGAGTTTGTTTGTTGDGSTEDGELDTGGSAGTTGDSDVIRLCGEPIEDLTFRGPEKLDGVNTNDDEQDPFVSADGQRLYFVRITAEGPVPMRAMWDDENLQATAPVVNSDLDGVPDAVFRKIFYRDDDEEAIVSAVEILDGMEPPADLWRLTRDAPSGPFTGSNPLAEQIGLGDNNLHDPHLSFNGLRLYFAARGPLLDVDTLFVTSRGTTAQAFSGHTMLDVNLDDAHDSSPTLNTNERVIVFSSSRDSGLADTDLWVAGRVTRESPFGEPIRLSISIEGRAEADPHLSADGCTLIWSTLDNSGDGVWNLYAARVERSD